MNTKRRDCKRWVGKFLLKERKRKIERQTDRTKPVFNVRKGKRNRNTDKQDRNSFLMKERGRERERETNKTEIVF